MASKFTQTASEMSGVPIEGNAVGKAAPPRKAINFRHHLMASRLGLAISFSIERSGSRVQKSTRKYFERFRHQDYHGGHQARKQGHGYVDDLSAAGRIIRKNRDPSTPQVRRFKRAPAINAPIPGSAADVISSVPMVRMEQATPKGGKTGADSCCRCIDELIFEAAEANAENILPADRRGDGKRRHGPPSTWPVPLTVDARAALHTGTKPLAGRYAPDRDYGAVVKRRGSLNCELRHMAVN